MQTVATKDPVSNRVDVTPRPDFGGNVLHGQFTTPGGHEALRPPEAVEEEEEDEEYRPDYTDQVSSFWNGLSEIQVCNLNDVSTYFMLYCERWVFSKLAVKKLNYTYAIDAFGFWPTPTDSVCFMAAV